MILKYFLQRFLGNYCQIDLERVDFSRDELVLRDLDLNCQTLNETISDKTPFKFVKCWIGELKINYQIGRQIQVRISVDKIDIVIIPIESNQAEEVEGQAVDQDSEQTQNDVQKEGLIDRLLGSLLQNLEVNVTNVAVRVHSRDSQDQMEPIPTFLLKVDRLSYTKNRKANDDQTKPDYVQDIHCLLHEKQCSVGEVSLFFMKDTWVNPNEYDKSGVFNAELNSANLKKFPFEYPPATHPSALLLFKGEQHALSVDFEFPTETNLQVNLKGGNYEVIVSQHDLVSISRIITQLTQSAKDGQELEKSQVMNQSLTQSFMQQSVQFRKTFAESLSQDLELRKSIEDFELLEQKLAETQKLSLSQVKISGQAAFQLVRLTLLFHTDINRVEDKVFQIFQPAKPTTLQPTKPTTSAEIYYELSIPNLSYKFLKKPDKPPAVVQVLSLSVKSYLRTARVDDHNLDQSDLMQTAVCDSLDDSQMFESAVGKDEFELVNLSHTVYTDANQFQVTDLSPAPHYDYNMIRVLEVQKTESKLQPQLVQFSVDKVFLHVNSTDLLVLQYLTQILSPKQTTEPNKKKIAAKKETSQGLEIRGELKGVEMELYMHKVNTYSFLKTGQLPLPESQIYGETSIGLNFSILVAINPKDNVQAITLYNVNLNALNQKNSVTLASIQQIQLLLGCAYESRLQKQTSQHELTTYSTLFEDDEAQDAIKFISKSSSNNEINGPIVPDEDYQLQNPTSSMIIDIKGALVEIDARDFDTISYFVVQQELALKHTSNIIDIYSLLDKKITVRPAILPTNHISIQVQDLKIKLLQYSQRQKASSQPLIELSLEQTELSLSLGGNKDLSYIDVQVKVDQIMLFDYLSQHISVYNPAQEEFIKDVRNSCTESYNTFEDKLLSGRAIVYKNAPNFPVLSASCVICFIEEGQMQSRIDLSFIQTEEILQLYADLGEMKVNPMRLKVQAKIKNLSAQCSNLTFKLGVQIQKQVAKLLNRLEYASKIMKINSNVKPRQKCLVDTSKQSTYLDLRLENLTFGYQPVLTLHQIQEVMCKDQAQRWRGQETMQLYKAPFIVLLKIDRTTLTSNGTDHHSLQTDQIRVFFLADNNPQNLENWVNYSEEGDRLAQSGFVSFLDIVNKKSFVKQKHVRLFIQSIRVGICADLMSQLIIFQRLTESSLRNNPADDLTQSILPIPQNKAPLQVVQEQQQEEENKTLEPAQHPLMKQDEVIVIVVGGNNQEVKYLCQNDSGSTQTSNKEIDFSLRMEKDYFKGSGTKNKGNRKKVHKQPDYLKEPELEATIDISLIKLTLFKGSDFDFKAGSQIAQPTFKLNLNQSSLMVSSQSLTAQQAPQRQRQSEFDPNYMKNANPTNLDLEIKRQSTQSTKRPRVTQRDQDKYFQISLSELCTTLRQFDMNQKQLSITTLSLSIGDVQTSVSVPVSNNWKKKELQMLESPYCYRQRNLIEMSCQVESKVSEEYQELQLEFSLRPTKLFVSQAPIDFIKLFFTGVNITNPQQQEDQSNQMQSVTVQNVNADAVQQKSKPLLVRSILIKESEIVISVKHLEDVMIGASFINLDAFTFAIERYSLVILKGQQLVSIAVATSKLSDFYIQQALRLDTFSRLLSSYKPFKAIGKGVYNICAPIYKPLVGARYGAVGVAAGLSDGLQDLTGYLKEESYGWTMSFVNYVYKRIY